MFESLAMLRISLKRFAQQDKFGLKMLDESESHVPQLHLHDLGFFVLEVIVDGFDEAVCELLHFAFDVAQLILGQRT
jgi:hypothetical protein